MPKQSAKQGDQSCVGAGEKEGHKTYAEMQSKEIVKRVRKS
jgi:hypothetical protein